MSRCIWSHMAPSRESKAHPFPCELPFRTRTSQHRPLTCRSAISSTTFRAQLRAVSGVLPCSSRTLGKPISRQVVVSASAAGDSYHSWLRDDRDGLEFHQVGRLRQPRHEHHGDQKRIGPVAPHALEHLEGELGRLPRYHVDASVDDIIQPRPPAASVVCRLSKICSAWTPMSPDPTTLPNASTAF